MNGIRRIDPDEYDCQDLYADYDLHEEIQRFRQEMAASFNDCLQLSREEGWFYPDNDDDLPC